MINKINLDGIEYDIGGSKAKLVATCPYTEEEEAFYGKINVPFYDVSGKFYILTIYDIDNDSLYISNILNENMGYGENFKIFDTNNSSYIELAGEYIYMSEFGNYFRFVVNEGAYMEQDGCYIEVYELPIILGGEE